MRVRSKGLRERPAGLNWASSVESGQGFPTSGIVWLRGQSSFTELHSGAIMVEQPKPTKGVAMAAYKQKFVEWAKKVFEEENETNPEMEGG